jgi:kynureninase
MPSAPRLDLGPFPDAYGYDDAIAQDRDDPLARERDGFVSADSDIVYLDGNSLGRLPVDTITRVDDTMRRQWGDRLIRSWHEGWWELPERIGELLAPVVGAEPGELLMSDSTSVNLFKLAAAALSSAPDRRRIITDDLNFPTDLYVLRSAARAAGAGQRVEVIGSDGVDGPMAAIEAAIDDETALVSLSHVTFKSGYVYDLARLTERAHEAGALVLWDLSHSVGSVPVELGATGADLAVGCTYKYLNGGPGAPAFLYVRRDLQDRLRNPIEGWWAHDDPFSFHLDFEPITGIRRFHTGTMPMLSLAGAEAGIAQVAAVGIEAIRAKSVALGCYMEQQWRRHLEPVGFGWASPTDPNRRGSHVSLSHPEAWQIAQAYREEAMVLPDFRSPDNLRLGFAPLYNSFLDLHTAVLRLRAVVETRIHVDYPTEREGVS